MRIYAFVDGESHYTRTLAAFRHAHGEDANIATAKHKISSTGSAAFPNGALPYIRLLPSAKFLWDVHYPFLAPGSLNGRAIEHAEYFTATSGDQEAFHNACVTIRAHGFTPHVAHEPTQLASRRAERRESLNLLEKAKGVDIGLSVQLLEGAYHNNFDICYVFTSDIDFLPAIQVVQRMGKKVVVFGYESGLSAHSKLRYVPDAFVDLSTHVASCYVPAS